MNDKQLVTVAGAEVPTVPEQLEDVLLNGNLGNLTSDQKVLYYKAVCESLGLNPLTKPFEFLKFQGKEVLYPAKGCAEQLRKISKVSLSKPDVQTVGDLMIVSVTATDDKGRTDTDCGVLNVQGLRGEALAVATMKAITKAKRRVTLSICGMGMPDLEDVDADKPGESELPAQPLSLADARKQIAEREQATEELKSEQQTVTVETEIAGPIYDLSTLTEKQLEFFNKSVFPRVANKQVSEGVYQFEKTLGDKFERYLIDEAEPESDTQYDLDNLNLG